jgi:hypothetical protein
VSPSFDGFAFFATLIEERVPFCFNDACASKPQLINKKERPSFEGLSHRKEDGLM